MPPDDGDARPDEASPPEPEGFADAEDRADPTPVVVEQREQLIRAARAVTGMDRHSAEDVVSIVTERVLRRGTVPRAAEAWLTYMQQAVVREARREAQRASLTVTLDGDELSGIDPTVDRVHARMQWLDAMDDLRVLPDDERQVFVLRHYDALTYAQIAVATGLPEDGVDNRLRRATKRLSDRRAERETSGAYLVFTLFARSARRTAQTSPPAIVVAGAATLSMLAALTVPAPHAVHADSPPRVPVARPLALPGARGRAEATGTSRDARQPAHAPAALPPAASRAAPRPGTPTASPQSLPILVTVCAGPACVASDGGRHRLRGDVVTVRYVPGPVVAQDAVAVCQDVPENPAVRCEADHPENYYVRRPEQEGASRGGKSNPSAPIGEPPKGPRP